jgi:hypothetical protein
VFGETEENGRKLCASYLDPVPGFKCRTSYIQLPACMSVGFYAHVNSDTYRHTQNLKVSMFICSMIKSKRMQWMGYVTCMGKMRNIYRILLGKPEGKRSLERL